MRILYGVQGTGNGHISRANAMHDAFRAHPQLQVTWLLSGRERARGCGAIADFQWVEGLSFVARNGRIDLLQTLRRNSIKQFCADVNALDLRNHDLLITDFEPVLAHAARKRGLPVIGIGHQYAFQYPIPKRGNNAVVAAIMKYFAPVTRGIGLHWHHFNQPVLPPIVDLHVSAEGTTPLANKVIVYLPFENAADVLQLLQPLREHEFYIYHPLLHARDLGHLHTRAISRDGFKRDLLGASKVITNSGFELISECLQLGKAILSKPLQGQMEQLSNAAALEQLRYATVTDRLDTSVIDDWLHSGPAGIQLHFPDVAAGLAAWIADGCRASAEELAQQLWTDTRNPLG